MTIGPIMKDIIATIDDNSTHDKSKLREILRKNPSDMRTLMKDYELAHPKISPRWDLHPWFDVFGRHSGYELRISVGELQMIELLDVDQVEHHLPADIPEAMISKFTGRAASEVFQPGPRPKSFWNGREIITGRQQTNGVTYLIVKLG